MDVQMPRRSGVEATVLITAACPTTRVIVLTTFDYDDYVFDAVKAGAMGYLLKDVPARDLIATIRFGIRQRILYPAPRRQQTAPGIWATLAYPSRGGADATEAGGIVPPRRRGEQPG